MVVVPEQANTIHGVLIVAVNANGGARSIEDAGVGALLFKRSSSCAAASVEPPAGLRHAPGPHKD